ncbi:MAG: transglycosylase SLT domain-containing protein [Desulfobaccales bacterium]
MSRVKLFLLTLLVLSLAPSLASGKVVRFTDSRGVLHITTADAEPRPNPGNPPIRVHPETSAAFPKAPAPEATARPGAPQATEPPAASPTPESDATPPRPEAGKSADRSAEPPRLIQIRTGSRGKIEYGNATPPAAAAAAPDQRPAIIPAAAGSAAPPRSAPGEIVRYKDPHGVIHITNLGSEAPPVQVAAAPAVPQSKPNPPPAQPPAWQPVSWPPPDFGAKAEKVAAISRGFAMAGGGAIRGYRDRRGVWHITNEAPEGTERPAPLEVRNLQARAPAPIPAAAQPIPPPPASALTQAAGLPTPTPAPQPSVLARRDPRGTLHIFNLPAGASGGSSLAFLGKLNQEFAVIIAEASQIYRLPPALIMAVIRMESNFVPQAVSPKGAMGLMQLMPGTATDLGVRNPFCPRENILAGCRYLRFLLDHFRGSLPLAVAAYNAGHQRVIAAGYQVPPIKETQEFVTQVLGLYYLMEKSGPRL